MVAGWNAHRLYDAADAKRDDGSLSDVWIMTIVSGEKKKLEDNTGSSDTARWSPDGKWIAYTGSPHTGGVSTSFLYLISAAGGTPKELTTKFDLNVGTPVWSRDGKTIYFSTNVLQAIEVSLTSSRWRCEAALATRRIDRNYRS